MAKRISLGIEQQLNDTEAQAVRTYLGATPPRGVYRCRITRVTLNMDDYGKGSNKNGDPYYTVGYVITHAKGEPKSRFNGFYRSGSLTINDQWMSLVAQFRDATGLSSKEFDKPMLEDDGTVTEWGRKKPDSLALRVVFSDGSYQGKRTLEVREFMPDEADKTDVEDAADDDGALDDDDFDADESDGLDEFAPENDDEGTEEESETEDEVAEEEDDDFEDDEPAPTPARRAAAKKAPAKAAPRKAAASTGTKRRPAF